jgi:hypothetical protein
MSSYRTVILLITLSVNVTAQELPDFLRQSFNVKAITSRAYNSLGVSLGSEGNIIYVSDKPKVPFQIKSSYKPFIYDLAENKSSRMPTKNLCEIDNQKYNVAGICTDDSSTFMIAAVNDISINDFMAESRVTLVHIDLSYGFSQCATPPFVQLGYTYTQPYYDSQTGYLYFASNMPGGKGGLDIYRVKRTGPNKWDNIESIDEINTPNNDVYPFIDNQGYLYYSTLTPKSGYDVFCWIEGSPTRLGSTVNSRVDDFNFVKINDKDAMVVRSSSQANSTVIYRLLAF